MKLLIVDDHLLVLDGLQMLLSTFEFVSEVHTANSFEEVKNVISNNEINFSLLDISLGKEDGRDVFVYLKKNVPDIKVIALTSHDDLSMIRSVFQAGFDGYLLKTDSRETIETALLSVKNNEKYFSPQTDFAFNKDLIGLDNINLSLRELEVLRLLVLGRTTKELAGELFISEKTVETHRAKIMAKLRVRNVAELIRKALQLNIVSLY